MARAAVIPLLLAVAGGVLYHAAAKSVPRDLAPALVLVVAYATALAISGVAHLVMPGPSGAPASWSLLHPAVLALGVGAAMIEIGYVLTYRADWPVSITSVMINGAVAVMLVPLGLLVFAEKMSWTRAAGMLLCMAGVWLLRH